MKRTFAILACLFCFACVPVGIGIESRTTAAAKLVLPSIVSVEVEEKLPPGMVPNKRNNKTPGMLLRRPVPGTKKFCGFGSGIVVSRDGYIITNWHVIDGAARITVPLGGKRYEAKLIGGSPLRDCALIKIDAKNLTPAVLGDSDALKPGQFVLAVGNPYGFDHTVSLGVVSYLDRVCPGTGQGYIQTDVAINPGSSGGALCTLDGKVVGITAAIVSYRGEYAGISLAVPINEVKEVLIKKLLQDRFDHRKKAGK